MAASMQTSEATEVKICCWGPQASLLCGAGSDTAHFAMAEQCYGQFCCCLVVSSSAKMPWQHTTLKQTLCTARAGEQGSAYLWPWPRVQRAFQPHESTWPSASMAREHLLPPICRATGQAWGMAPAWCWFLLGATSATAAPTAGEASARPLRAHQRALAKLPSPKPGAQQCLHYFWGQHRRFSVNSLQKGGSVVHALLPGQRRANCTHRDSAKSMFWVAKCRSETPAMARQGSSNTHQLTILCHSPSKDNSLHRRVFHKVWQVVTEAAHTGQPPHAAATTADRT